MLFVDRSESWATQTSGHRPNGYVPPYVRRSIMKIAIFTAKYTENISGVMGKEKVHYQASDSDNIPFQMKLFLDWANDDQKIDPVLKAAIAHLWFVAIHPSDDGNGRIARTIIDLFLARADEMPHRFYSISAEIRKQLIWLYAIYRI